jgi:hypothetical protein
MVGGTPHLTPTLSAPKGGEGELLEYHLHHTPNVFHHIPVPKPYHAIASAADFLSPQLIRAERDRMLSAIQLDHELRRRTRKVHHISAYRMLPAKPMWAPELAQLPPQLRLGLGHISPEPPRQHCPAPNPHSISIRTAPYSTGWASATRICAMRPGRCARIWFITFIASMISKGCPSATESPSRTNGGSPGCGAR